MVMNTKIPPELFPKTQEEAESFAAVQQLLASRKPRQKSRKLTAYDAQLAKVLMELGYNQHDIAAYMRCNQGRMSELRKSLI